MLLIWPFAARLTTFLEARFKSAEEDEARPRHLDKNVLAVPTLALDALEREVRHMGDIALGTVRATIDEAARPGLARHHQVVARLNLVIADFVIRLHGIGMSGDNARRLPEILRLARYYEAATELAVEASASRGEIANGESIPEATAFADTALALLALANPAAAVDLIALEAATGDMERAYQTLKACLLQAGAQGRLPVSAMDARLRAASGQRRALEQAVKAARLLTATPHGRV